MPVSCGIVESPGVPVTDSDLREVVTKLLASHVDRGIPYHSLESVAMERTDIKDLALIPSDIPGFCPLEDLGVIAP
jgi:hypothetical protein